MKKSITVPLPINLSDRDKDLYEPYVDYEFPSQKIKNLNNIFVMFSGFCMNSRGLIKECHHAYPQQYNNYLIEARHYYNDITIHPENLITLSDDITYLVIHHPWFNYYHWICEAIFRLWLVRDHIDNLVLILPEYYKNHDFIMGSLAPFDIKKIFYIPDGKSLLVGKLCLPQIKPVCDSYNAFHLQEVSSFYKSYVREKSCSAPSFPKLYVSRELAGRRKIVNEERMLEILIERGFSIFHPERYSFLDQVAIFANVKFLVGIHGSGLTNMLFMGKGTSVLELHKEKTNELDHPSPLFWYMAEAIGIKYFHQVCETHGEEDYFKGDYIVDCDLFERNLIRMISENVG